MWSQRILVIDMTSTSRKKAALSEMDLTAKGPGTQENGKKLHVPNSPVTSGILTEGAPVSAAPGSASSQPGLFLQLTMTTHK